MEVERTSRGERDMRSADPELPTNHVVTQNIDMPASVFDRRMCGKHRERSLCVMTAHHAKYADIVVFHREHAHVLPEISLLAVLQSCLLQFLCLLLGMRNPACFLPREFVDGATSMVR
jgi:hypothetical protein